MQLALGLTVLYPFTQWRQLPVTDFQEIEVQELAVEAARIHLSTLEDVETIRPSLTPEFLLVKLQAQNDLALAQRAHAAAIANYNVAIVRLAQAAGTVLQLHQMEQALSAVTAAATY